MKNVQQKSSENHNGTFLIDSTSRIDNTFLLQQASQRIWYLQGLEGYPLLISFPLYYGAAKLKEFYGMSYDLFVVYCKNNLCELFFDKDHFRKFAWWMLQKKLDDPLFVDKVAKMWEKRKKPFYQHLKKIREAQLSTWTGRQLEEEYRHFTDVFLDTWRDFMFVDAFDPCWEEIIQIFLKRHQVSLSSEEISILASPTKLSFLQEERRNLLRLAIRHKKKLYTMKTFPELQQHQQDYFWLQDNYGQVKCLDDPFFLQRAKGLLQEKDPARQLYDLESYEKRQTAARQKVRQRLPEELALILDFFSELSWARDQRKAFMLQGNAAVYHLMEEYARRLLLPTALLCQLSLQEVPGILKSPPQRKGLEQRQQQGLIIYISEQHPITVLEKGAEEIRSKILEQAGAHQEVPELRGTPAQSGLAQGTVRIINKQEDFSKMKQGDILVSMMTRPEFLPIMKKAAAIVTDEGGITCHAAIVARELKIPCIVGTQKATKMLKDGQRVEVDANKGVVRKL